MSRDIEQELSVTVLHQLFDADFEKGLLTWRHRPVTNWRVKTWNARFAGKVAGRLNTAGHVQIAITIDGVKFMSVAHRVLWAMEHGHWPGRGFHLDHLDHDKAANGRGETRIATPMQNMRNKRRYANNTSGFKGVTFYRKNGRWMAQISVNKRNKNLGLFENREDAARAYDTAAIAHFGEFAKTNAQMGLL